MDNLPVIHLDNQGGTGYIDVFDNYTDLITQYPSPPIMSLAFVQNSQGTAWLPGGMGGDFYSKGSYLFDGANWVSSVDDISKELQDILNVINTQNLEQVLAEGIFSGPYNISMNDSQVVKATNGDGSLNLRDGANGKVNLKSTKVNLSLDNFIARITSGSFFVDPFIGSLSIGQDAAQISMSKGDLTKNGILGFVNNENGDVVSSNTPSYPTAASSQNNTIKQGVVNVDVSGGKDIIAKTDNSNYANQIAYNKLAEVYELIVNHATPTANRTQTHQDLDGVIALLSDVQARMSWKGIWVDGTYILNDVVRDGGWTMIANKTTTDRPAPQDVGLAEDSINKDADFIDSNDNSVVKMVHNFTMTKSGWLKTLDVRVPFWDLDSISKVTLVNITNNTAFVIDSPILSSDEWTTLSIGETIVASGDQLKIIFEFYNSSASSITGRWTSWQAGGVPTSQRINIDSFGNPNTIEISHTDLDSVNRSAELDGVVVDSIMTVNETADISRSFQVKVTAVDTVSATSTKYSVDLLSSGSKVIRNDQPCTVNIDIPLTQPSRYDKLTAYYPTNNPSWSTITTELYFDGVQQAGAVDAFGINLNFQEASVSDDWELVATSEGAGSQAQTGVFQEATSLSIIDSGQAFVTDSVGTLLANDAATVVDSTKGGAKEGHGNYDVAGSFFDVSLIEQPCQILFKCVVEPTNNANFGIEYRSYTDKTNIPGSLAGTQSSAYKVSRTGMDNEVTTSFMYNPAAGKVEALQIFGVSQASETITLGFFNIWLNKLWQ